MTKLLITGGSGYLGGELVRQAAASGAWDIIATYTTNQRAVEGVRFVALDLRDEAAIAALLHDERPDVVIHTAFVQNEPDLWRITARGAGHVARSAREIGARLIHMSSDALFDGEKPKPYTEDDAPSPITAYGEAKAGAERMLAEQHPDALIVRTSLIYGGDGSSKHEHAILDAIKRDSGFVFFTDEIRNPVLVGDLATALLELAPTNERGVLNIAGAHAVSRYEFACLVAAHAGLPAESLKSGSSRELGIRRPRFVELDSTRAQQFLRTKLRGVHDVLGKR